MHRFAKSPSLGILMESILQEWNINDPTIKSSALVFYKTGEHYENSYYEYRLKFVIEKSKRVQAYPLSSEFYPNYGYEIKDYSVLERKHPFNKRHVLSECFLYKCLNNK